MTGTEIDYEANGTTLKGYLAQSANAEPSAGVLIVPEWWGHNPYVRQRADQLAALGYTALAVDMYGNGELADTPDRAGRADERFLRGSRRDARTLRCGVCSTNVRGLGRCGEGRSNRLLLWRRRRAGDGARRCRLGLGWQLPPPVVSRRRTQRSRASCVRTCWLESERTIRSFPKTIAALSNKRCRLPV